ncbi:MAG: hypothetical protein KC432_10150, partial [Thermomicrobiales bacterium]|nr:hypothetical protein [Thermomicrobiales bacterium]
LASQRYLVDGDTVIGGNQGRILRVDQAGNATQLLTPEDAESGNALANVDEVAIDELTGTVFWIADGVIWQARLPPA